MSDHELRHIAIGYDESIDYDPVADTEGDELVEAMDVIIMHLLAHADAHHACLMVIREFPPANAGSLSRMIFDLGLAMYLGKPLVIVYKTNVEVPEYIRKLATHCISFEGDDPLASTTVQAIMARYA